MKTINKLIIIAGLFLFTTTGCKKDKTYSAGDVNVEFDNIAGNAHVDVFGTTNYTNALGETFNITKLKYYVSNVELIKSDGSVYKVPESYFLVDESLSSSHMITLGDVPGGKYTGIRYMIGVDSIRNVSGAQTGALDPVNGMFWTWNSGYIFFKLEGTSPAAISGTNTTGDYFLHIGGFKQATGAAMRTLEFSFGTDLIVDGAREADIHMIVDILELFKNPVNISLAVDNDVMMPGATAIKIADNYKDMFTFDHIHNGE